MGRGNCDNVGSIQVFCNKYSIHYMCFRRNHIKIYKLWVAISDDDYYFRFTFKFDQFGLVELNEVAKRMYRLYPNPFDLATNFDCITRLASIIDEVNRQHHNRIYMYKYYKNPKLVMMHRLTPYGDRDDARILTEHT